MDHREPPRATADFAGYEVEPIDGGTGKIDEASYDVGAGYIVLDTSPWSLWKKVMLPAGVIMRVDSEEENVFVNHTRTLPSSTWTRTATTRTCA
jgi:hypothetical protein